MNKAKKVLNVSDVIARISVGDFPVVVSSFSCASSFDDRVEIPHQIMHAAANHFDMDSPGRGNRWSLRSQN